MIENVVQGGDSHSALLEGDSHSAVAPSVRTDPIRFRRVPSSNRLTAVSSRPVLTSHVTSPPSADGSQSEPATAFAAAEDVDWPPFGRRTPSAVGKRLAKRTETLHERCNTNGSECRRATVTQSTRVPWSAELVAAQLGVSPI